MIKESRLALAQAIGAVHFLPERIQPPIAVVVPSSPYVVPETYCDYEGTFEVTLIVARQSSENALDALDDYIDETLSKLPRTCSIDYVDKPYLLEYNGAVYLATTMYVKTTL